MTKVEGERTRLREQLTRLRGLIHGLELTIDGGHPCAEAAQAVADAGIRLVTHAGRLDAFIQADRQRGPGPVDARKGCTLDTDGDGNCPVHPRGCP